MRIVYYNKLGNIVTGYWQVSSVSIAEDNSIYIPASKFFMDGIEYNVEELTSSFWFPRNGDKVYLEVDQLNPGSLIYCIVQEDSIEKPNPIYKEPIMWVENDTLYVLKHFGLNIGG